MHQFIAFLSKSNESIHERSQSGFNVEIEIILAIYLLRPKITLNEVCGKTWNFNILMIQIYDDDAT